MAHASNTLFGIAICSFAARYADSAKSEGSPVVGLARLLRYSKAIRFLNPAESRRYRNISGKFNEGRSGAYEYEESLGGGSSECFSRDGERDTDSVVGFGSIVV